MRSFWEISLFDEANNIYTHFVPRLAGSIMHNRHLVLRRKIPHPNWASCVKDSWATRGTVSQNKQCQPKKNSYMLRV